MLNSALSTVTDLKVPSFFFFFFFFSFFFVFEQLLVFESFYWAFLFSIWAEKPDLMLATERLAPQDWHYV